MKEGIIVVRDNFTSKTEEEKREIIKKNIIRLIVKACSKKP